MKSYTIQDGIYKVYKCIQSSTTLEQLETAHKMKDSLYQLMTYKHYIKVHNISYEETKGICLALRALINEKAKELGALDQE